MTEKDMCSIRTGFDWQLNLGANLRNIRCALKDQLDGFDSLRDTQVVLTEISGTIQEIPNLLSSRNSCKKLKNDCCGLLKRNLDRSNPANPSNGLSRKVKFSTLRKWKTLRFACSIRSMKHSLLPCKGSVGFVLLKQPLYTAFVWHLRNFATWWK